MRASTASSILSTNPDGSFNTVATTTISGLATPNTLVAVFEDGVIIGWSPATPGELVLHRPGLTVDGIGISFEAVNQLGILSGAVDPIKMLMM